MGWFSNLISDGASKVIDSVGSAIDELVTSDEEKLIIRNKLQESMNDFKIQMKSAENDYEKELTKRNEADQQHGSFLTKSIRPLFLVWVMAIITILIFGGMSGHNVKSGYLDLITALSITAVSFFFGSKGIEIYKHGKLI